MPVIMAQTWTIKCDKGECGEWVEFNGSLADAKDVARQSGWEVLSLVSVRCPAHVRHPEWRTAEGTGVNDRP